MSIVNVKKKYQSFFDQILHKELLTFQVMLDVRYPLALFLQNKSVSRVKLKIKFNDWRLQNQTVFQ